MVRRAGGRQGPRSAVGTGVGRPGPRFGCAGDAFEPIRHGWISVPARSPAKKSCCWANRCVDLADPGVDDLLSRRLHDAITGPDDDYSRNLRGENVFIDAMVAWNGKGHLKDLQGYSAALLGGAIAIRSRAANISVT